MVGNKRTASVEEIMKDKADVDQITRMCGHYTLNIDEVKKEIKVLEDNMKSIGLDGDFYVIKKIKDSIDRYIYCFNLYGSTSKILNELNK